MGDRYDREIYLQRRRNGGGLKPPELILDWGLSPNQKPVQPPPEIGHNGGPPIEESADLYVRHLWTMAHREVWKNPHMDIVRFRLARAEAAGISYHDYMLCLLDTGRHPQKVDAGQQTGQQAARAKTGKSGS
jgi:hypothetical protein